jgi:molecular chaperone GrpE (heat shock protein)
MLRRVRSWLSDAPVSPPSPVAVPDDTKLDELGSRLQTVARAQSKLSLRLDELGEQIASNHAQLLARLDAPRSSHAPSYEGVLDAIDRLDDATRSLGPDQRGLAEGLEAIAARLDRVLASDGIVRRAEVGAPPDGRRVRVIGTERRGDLPEGVITRVVRSAATRDDQLLREGEVLVNKLGD